MNTSIIWFRHDVRLQDNLALVAASRAQALVPVFILDPSVMAGAGPNRVSFLIESLVELAQTLEAAGSRLLVLEGRPAELLPALAQALGGATVHVTAGATPLGRQRDKLVAAALHAAGAELAYHPGLWAVDSASGLTSAAGRPYQVFTPFYKAWLAQKRRSVAPVPALPPFPALPPTVGTWQVGEPAAEVLLRHRALSASAGRIPGGRAAAEQRLQTFLDGPVDRYGQEQNSLEPGATSRLSADLHFGILSMREVEAALPSSEGGEAFRRQLAWRDFYLYILAHFPESRTSEFQARYRTFDWQHDDDLAEAWRSGRTGYPIVDAAMRQLLAEGFMPNRARLIVGSFLTKDLGLDWRVGEAHFRHWLTDGDVAANVGNWQWIASVGVDPAPVFRRLYNPSTQQTRYDPTGTYVRRWVPELAKVPLELLAEPWRMTEAQQQAAGCIIGRQYPGPVIDHALARQAALERYRLASSS